MSPHPQGHVTTSVIFSNVTTSADITVTINLHFDKYFTFNNLPSNKVYQCVHITTPPPAADGKAVTTKDTVSYEN